MEDPLRPRPRPLPPPDQHQVERLNSLYELSAPDAGDVGWRGRIVARLRALIARILFRQQAFNAALVDHLNRNVAVGVEMHRASLAILAWMEAITDDVQRYREAIAARERRSESAVASLAASHDEVRTALAVLQQAAQTLKRQVGRLGEGSVAVGAGAAEVTTAYSPMAPAPAVSIESHKYVAFEDCFRGSQEEIRARVREYLPIFQGSSDVLDIGCGRGEFLALLREHGIDARGVDINDAMIGVCRDKGLSAEVADALEYVRAQPDNSLGGLFAAQVVEHLEPRYLTGLLDAAFAKLRPGSPIVLETINPACWFAFFESYLRDPTHVRPVHPDTLKYLLIASGFQKVDIHYRAPYPDNEKLQPLPAAGAAGAPNDWVETINANVEKINRLLFTWLDYAAVGYRT